MPAIQPVNRSGLLRCNGDISRLARWSGGLGGVVGLLDAGGELDVAGGQATLGGLKRTRVALVQRMSMSGWWRAASTAVATWLTKSSPLELV
jgi:hypothetical protein